MSSTNSRFCHRKTFAINMFTRRALGRLHFHRLPCVDWYLSRTRINLRERLRLRLQCKRIECMFAENGKLDGTRSLPAIGASVFRANESASQAPRRSLIRIQITSLAPYVYALPLSCVQVTGAGRIETYCSPTSKEILLYRWFGFVYSTVLVLDWST